MTFLMILVIVLALCFDLTNGIRDSTNIVATMISSRSLLPRNALIITALAEFAGPFLFGVAVAKTIVEVVIGKGTINLLILVAALVSAIFWNLFTWFLGLPSSSSHALIGGLVGAVVCGAGWQVIQWPSLIKVLIALFTSPIIGLIAGYLISRLVVMLCRNATPRINLLFKRAQILTAVALALSYGANDAQKTMGVITLGLVTAGYLKFFTIPTWVIVACAGMVALGTTLSARRLIRTLGTKFYHIRPMDSFNTQLASAGVILGASLLGGPVSTTQVVSAAILGVGAAERVNKVRWGVVGEIATAWLLTIPATGLIGAGLYWAMRSLWRM
jgi:PiT family inorganic phosphate transporter